MNKLFTTILAILAIAAFSTKAEAADINSSLSVEITVQIAHDLEIVWDDGAGGETTDPQTWALGSSVSVALGGTYDSATHDPAALNIINKTTNVPIQLDIALVNDGFWTHVTSKTAPTPLVDEFTMGFAWDGAAAYTNIPQGSSVSMATGIPPAGSGTPDDTYSLALEIEVPNSVSRGTSGTIVVGVYASVY